MSSLSETSSTTKHTFDTQQKKSKAEAQAMTLFLFCCRLVLLQFEVSVLFLFSMAYPHYSKCSGSFRCPTNIDRNPFTRLTAHIRRLSMRVCRITLHSQTVERAECRLASQ